MLTIGDLVTMDLQGTFRSDVQLSDYDDPALNLELLEHYIFTTKAPESRGLATRRLSSFEVLERLRDAYLVDRVENRITLVANYGHGKSHLALTLANYFARPAASREVKTILQRLGQALSNSAQLANYQQFKEKRGEFLVVRLRGDTPFSLREQFLEALESALREHSATQLAQLPFWYIQAEKALRNLTGQDLQRANAFLKPHDTDVPGLCQRLRQAGARDLCRQLFRHLHNVPPDFGAEIGLKEAVLWAVDEWCGPGKPLGGLLILFDEFSLFVQRYVKSGPSGDLQDLLNGVSDRQGRAAFVAFSQHDPRTVATSCGASGQRLEAVNHELSRLPDHATFALYSLMESVINSYLKQSDQNWQTWANQRPVKAYCARARNITQQHFSRRYNDELRWSIDAYDQTVVRGCFPLHPLTTAILSTHRFQAGEDVGTPRTVLGFIKSQVEDRKEQPALENDQPNCVWPVALVDYFEGRLSGEDYAAYQTAVTRAETVEELRQKLDVHTRVLKALFLQSVTKIAASGGDQLDLLAEMGGLPRDAVRDALRQLADHKVIQYDSSRKLSSFWPVNINPSLVEDAIKELLESIVVDQDFLEDLSNTFVPDLEVQTELGHAQDWAARQVLLTSEMFTPSVVRDYVHPFRASQDGIVSGRRGLVIWLIARNDEEKIELRQGAAQILEQALEGQEHPLPIVVMLPRKPMPEILDAFRRHKALARLPAPKRRELGDLLFNQELERAQTTVRTLITRLQGEVEHYADLIHAAHEMVVPAAYRAAVNALPQPSLRTALAECYRLAYNRPGFYTQYQLGGRGVNKLRDAVKKTAPWLLQDKVGDGLPMLPTQDIQKQLCEQYLVARWGLLKAGSYAVQEPTQSGLRRAWEYLDEQFAPGGGERPVRPALLALFNPPYGHDYNTLLLLLSAWIGYHQFEIRLALGGVATTVQGLKQKLEQAKGPKEFLDDICCSLSPLTIARSDAEQTLNEARALTERIRNGPSFSQQEATDALARLDQALSNPRLPSAQRDEMEYAKGHLSQALSQARDYDRKAHDILNCLQAAGIDELLKHHGTFGDLPDPSIVLASAPQVDELWDQWLQAVSQKCKATCAQYEQLKDIAEYAAHQQKLQHLRQQLDKAGLVSLTERVDQALSVLEQCAGELREQEKEKPILAEIKSMISSVPLKQLYLYRQRLEALGDQSERIARLRQEKLAEIQNRIEQHERFVEEMGIAIETIRSQTDLEKLREGLLRHYHTYEGTELQLVIDQVLQRADQLRDFFAQVTEAARHPLHSPADFEKVYQQLDAIESRAATLVGTAQQAYLQQVRREVDNKRAKLTEEARAWLDAREKAFARGEWLGDLLRQLDAPPQFLPEADVARLKKLRELVVTKLEQSIMTKIEELFHLIRDPQKRRECLARLQRIMDNES